MKQALIGLILLSSFLLFAQPSSENNERLRQALIRYQEADLNKDGVLTKQEADRYKKIRKSQLDKKTKYEYKLDPTFKEEKYGPFDRNVLDFWQADVDRQAPVIVYIHGGGFVSGSKEKAENTGLIKKAVERGIHFASINYRYKYGNKEHLNDPQRTGTPNNMLDGVRAIQYLKFNADKFNIEKDKVIVFGGSAGGSICIMMGLHDDLANPGSNDPVLHESSRVFAVGHFNSQPTTDVEKFIKILGFPREELEQVAKQRPMDGFEYARLGFKSEEEMKANTELAEKYKSMLDMSSHASSDDPPVFISNTISNIGIPTNHNEVVHHPNLSLYLDKVCRENGIKTKLYVTATQGVPKEKQYDEFFDWVSGLLSDEYD